jgi:hypothetical protein
MTREVLSRGDEIVEVADSIKEYIEGYIKGSSVEIEEMVIQYNALHITLNYKYLILDHVDMEFYQKVAEKHNCKLAFHISPVYVPFNIPYLRIMLHFIPRTA